MRWIPDLWPQFQIRGHNSGWVDSTRDETFKIIVLRPRCQMATWSDDWKYFLTYLQINKVSTAVAKQFDRWLKVNYNLFGLRSYFLVAICHLSHMIEMQKRLIWSSIFWSTDLQNTDFDHMNKVAKYFNHKKKGILILWNSISWPFPLPFCYCFERMGHSIDFYHRNF